MDLRPSAIACDAPRLAQVAAELGSDRDPDRAIALLRARGEPHVRPRVVSISGSNDLGAIRARLEAERRPETRCGAAFLGNDVVAVMVDALADLEDFPTRARTGQWLTFTADVHAPLRKAKVVVLGPRGLPRTVPTKLDGKRVQARFALDRPGAFTVQLVGDLAEGPRPLLEARVFADVEPTDADATPAQALEASSPDDPASALEAQIAALRSSEKIPPLIRDPRLDALAKEHAEAMTRAHAVAHDLGEGDFAARFEAAGLEARVVGENVARARSLLRGYRALHASPSHRLNLLRADYTHMGLAVVPTRSAKTPESDLYICQVFAGGLR